MRTQRLATSYGVRTMEDLLEALFNPISSEAPEQTPFTYHALPTSPSESAKTRSSQSFNDNDSSDPHGNGRGSVYSSVGSASVAGSTSEASSFDPGMAADAATMNSNRHWWQKMRSRPGTPASTTKTSFRPSTPAPPVPVRIG